MDPVNVALISFWLLILGAALTALLGRARRASGYVAFLFALAAWIGFTYVAIFRDGPIEAGPLVSVPSIGAALTLTIDNLSAIFLVLITFLGMLAALYSIRYMDSYPEEDLRRYHPFFLLFIAGMVGVVCVSDMFFFFVFWEFMTLASYLLVVFERESEINLRAGIKYFVMTHVATACMFVAAILLHLQAGHSFGFSALQQGMISLAAGGAPVLHLILLLFLIGFATKAGIFPLGDWLPDAHPAAPSGVSAMLSGVMIKLGVYGMLRIFVWMLPVSHASLFWGWLIAGLGTLSLFVGSLTALSQNDSKRLLAFSSIGQMGYIFLALGTAIAFLPISPAIAAIALIAVLYHTVNDGCFKALLFLNAGSLVYRTGTRDLNRLSGLGKIMPLTAVTTLIGCLAVAGLPPLNGFASKWLIFQATIFGGMEIPIYAAFGVLGLFVSVVTLAYVVKFFGAAFLGVMDEGTTLKPDAGSGAEPREVPTSMQLPQAVLAVACIALGLAPLFVMRVAYGALPSLVPASYWPSFSTLSGAQAGAAGLLGAAQVNLGEGVSGAWSPIVIAIVGLICLFIADRIYRVGRAAVRAVDVWQCGEVHRTAETRYAARSYYAPFQDFLKMRIGRYHLPGLYPHLSVPRIGRLEGLRRALDIDRWLIYPSIAWGGRVLRTVSRVHVGIPQVYVMWMVVGMIVGIVVLFWLA